MVRGRPKSANPRGHMVSVKFSDAEKEVLERVIAAWTEEAEAIGTEVSASSLIRALIKREAKARGLDVKPGEAADKQSSKESRARSTQGEPAKPAERQRGSKRPQ